jgi:flagellar biosynthesis protein FlhA
MADTTASGGGAFRLPTIGEIGDLVRRSDIALAIAVMTILVVLILPLPPLLLDFALAASIIFSVLILMTALFIHAPLECSAFPTVLLISTMLRLSLNLASTRLILAHGHEGPPPATSSRRSAISSWRAISSSGSSCSRSW